MRQEYGHLHNIFVKLISSKVYNEVFTQRIPGCMLSYVIPSTSCLLKFVSFGTPPVDRWFNHVFWCYKRRNCVDQTQLFFSFTALQFSRGPPYKLSYCKIKCQEVLFHKPCYSGFERFTRCWSCPINFHFKTLCPQNSLVQVLHLPNWFPLGQIPNHIIIFDCFPLNACYWDSFACTIIYYI